MHPTYKCRGLAGILLAFTLAGVPQFQGPRLAAFAALLWAFGAAALPHTYVLHFAFEVELPSQTSS